VSLHHLVATTDALGTLVHAASAAVGAVVREPGARLGVAAPLEGLPSA
jgi:hypothetical protein